MVFPLSWRLSTTMELCRSAHKVEGVSKKAGIAGLAATARRNPLIQEGTFQTKRRFHLVWKSIALPEKKGRENEELISTPGV